MVPAGVSAATLGGSGRDSGASAAFVAATAAFVGRPGLGATETNGFAALPDGATAAAADVALAWAARHAA